jgi:hypothetical protein
MFTERETEGLDLIGGNNKTEKKNPRKKII